MADRETPVLNKPGDRQAFATRSGLSGHVGLGRLPTRLRSTLELPLFGFCVRSSEAKTNAGSPNAGSPNAGSARQDSQETKASRNIQDNGNTSSDGPAAAPGRARPRHPVLSMERAGVRAVADMVLSMGLPALGVSSMGLAGRATAGPNPIDATPPQTRKTPPAEISPAEISPAEILPENCEAADEAPAEKVGKNEPRAAAQSRPTRSSRAAVLREPASGGLDPTLALVQQGALLRASLVVGTQGENLEEGSQALCQVLGACGLVAKVSKIVDLPGDASPVDAPGSFRNAQDGPAPSGAQDGQAPFGVQTRQAADARCWHEVATSKTSVLWTAALALVPKRQAIYFVWTGNWQTDLLAVYALRLRGERGAIMALSRCDFDPSARSRLLEAGADDVWMAPREPEELVACTKALLARMRIKIESDIRAFINLRLDYSRRCAWVVPRAARSEGQKVRLLADRAGANAIALTQLEFHLLDLLIRRAGAGVSVSEFEGNQYSDGRYPGKGTRDVYMVRLRRKLAAAGAEMEIASSSGSAVLRRAPVAKMPVVQAPVSPNGADTNGADTNGAGTNGAGTNGAGKPTASGDRGLPKGSRSS